MKNTEIRHFRCFFTIERTETVRVVMSDLFLTRLGNDGLFLTVLTQKCSSGHRRGGPYCNSLQKVLPLRVS